VAELQERLDEAGGGDEQIAAMQAKIQHWKSEAERLSGENEAQERRFREKTLEDLRKDHLQRFQRKLESHLHPTYADRVARDPEVAGRIRLTEDGEGYEVLQEGKEIPMTVPKDKDPLDVLAAEIVRNTPPDLIRADGDGGSGIDGGSGGGVKSVGQRFLEKKRERQRKATSPLQPFTGHDEST
jgi:hypothetical protein